MGPSEIRASRATTKPAATTAGRKVALALTFASAFGLSGALLDNGSSGGWSLGSVAWAQDKKTVSVLEIQGAPPKLKAAIEKALRAKYTLVPEAKWNATARKLNLDRHWRNARAIGSHSPLDYKAHAVGDYVVNGTPPPASGYF